MSATRDALEQVYRRAHLPGGLNDVDDLERARLGRLAASQLVEVLSQLSLVVVVARAAGLPAPEVQGIDTCGLRDQLVEWRDELRGV